jgi:2'-5' RNA ligase
MQKAERTRWWIAIFLKDLAPGTVFTPNELHLTLIPWFTTGTDDKQVKAEFLETFKGESKLFINLHQRLNFGNDQDIPVVLADATPQLLRLHHKSLRLFEALGAHWAVKNPYVDEEYKPHIRERGDQELKSGTTIEATSISLISAKRQEDNVRVVAAKVGLDAVAPTKEAQGDNK